MPITRAAAKKNNTPKSKSAAERHCTLVGGLQTANNTRMPGGQSAAPNCRFEASVTVHSLRSGGVMSAMRQLRQCVERWRQC